MTAKRLVELGGACARSRARRNNLRLNGIWLFDALTLGSQRTEPRPAPSDRREAFF